MSLNRVVLVGLAAAFTVGMTSFASAGGWGWGAGWGSGWGCGTCAAPSAAIVYAQPVAPLPPPPPPSVVVGWTGCGCHQSLVYAAPPIEPTPIAPAPIYVVNQGPAYEGPGITVPYHTWTPVSGYGPVGAYPYGYGLGYGYRHHFGYGYRYGLGYGYRHGLGYRYGYGPRPWRVGAHVAYHRHFGGYPGHHWPMMRRPWYR
jgi:hypothetical protein